MNKNCDHGEQPVAVYININITVRVVKYNVNFQCEKVDQSEVDSWFSAVYPILGPASHLIDKMIFQPIWGKLTLRFEYKPNFVLKLNSYLNDEEVE